MGAKLPKGIHHKHDKKESALKAPSPSKHVETERPFTVGQPCFIEGQSTWWWDLPVELQVMISRSRSRVLSRSLAEF